MKRDWMIDAENLPPRDQANFDEMVAMSNTSKVDGILAGWSPPRLTPHVLPVPHTKITTHVLNTYKNIGIIVYTYNIANALQSNLNEWFGDAHSDYVDMCRSYCTKMKGLRNDIFHALNFVNPDGDLISRHNSQRLQDHTIYSSAELINYEKHSMGLINVVFARYVHCLRKVWRHPADAHYVRDQDMSSFNAIWDKLSSIGCDIIGKTTLQQLSYQERNFCTLVGIGIASVSSRLLERARQKRQSGEGMVDIYDLIATDLKNVTDAMYQLRLCLTKGAVYIDSSDQNSGQMLALFGNSPYCFNWVAIWAMGITHLWLYPGIFDLALPDDRKFSRMIEEQNEFANSAIPDMLIIAPICQYRRCKNQGWWECKTCAKFHCENHVGFCRNRNHNIVRGYRRLVSRGPEDQGENRGKD